MSGLPAPVDIEPCVPEITVPYLGAYAPKISGEANMEIGLERPN